MLAHIEKAAIQNSTSAGLALQVKRRIVIIMVYLFAGPIMRAEAPEAGTGIGER
jgi:hypothetical protein